MTVLGLTQIMAWGSSYYLPAVIAPKVSADTGWPLAWVVGGLSLGLLIAGLISPRVGSSIERNGGRGVLAFSAVAIGAGQIGLAAAPNLVAYIVAWLVIGLGMGAGLYDAAFATLGRLYGYGARLAITTLTLFGGLASTICWPISAFLMAEIGWRGACLSYAAVQLLIALPLYLIVLPRDMPEQPTKSAPEDPAVPARENNSNLGIMIVLATTLTLAAVISSTLSVHLLSILQGRGMALAAAVALGALVGPSQVGARAIEMMVARYHHPIWTKYASVTFVAIGVAALWAGLPFIPGALCLLRRRHRAGIDCPGNTSARSVRAIRLREAHGPSCHAQSYSAGGGSFGRCFAIGTFGRPRALGRSVSPRCGEPSARSALRPACYATTARGLLGNG